MIGRRGQGMPLDGQGNKAFSYLTHQRVSDRGLVEKTLEYMEQMTRNSNDAIASKLVIPLQTLLAMEASSTDGMDFTAEFSAGTNCQESGYSGRVNDDGNELSLCIPHCGGILIANASTVIDSLPSFAMSIQRFGLWEERVVSTSVRFRRWICAQNAIAMQDTKPTIETVIPIIDGYPS
ncbi:hypothetical protein BU23DRAFT_566751 [Bimuria novae-zelandiae CBS 107.79]|uniref:Uncharacterized protein n=1 Tax=Bimuria novae-zelandiae CBS 107.79 TaxID=1447943 RepID=A0A6A5VDH3_9PLEO|nr:hypothetical protein BU23DRAFT_566751 [Bimuria novae-zelandiae CBS 107.79]